MKVEVLKGSINSGQADVGDKVEIDNADAEILIAKGIVKKVTISKTTAKLSSPQEKKKEAQEARTEVKGSKTKKEK